MEPGLTVSGRTAAYVLVEVLIYIAVLALVMELSFSAFYRCLTNARDLARNTDDVLQTLAAGERWRADVRLAVGPPQMVSEGEVSVFEIPKSRGSVAYIFADHAIWRQAGQDSAKLILSRVKDSRLIREERQKVTTWRWELELATRKKVVRVRPLFTFLATPYVKPL